LSTVSPSRFFCAWDRYELQPLSSHRRRLCAENRRGPLHYRLSTGVLAARPACHPTSPRPLSRVVKQSVPRCHARRAPRPCLHENIVPPRPWAAMQPAREVMGRTRSCADRPQRECATGPPRDLAHVAIVSFYFLFSSNCCKIQNFVQN
jgi:hypothetical protein